MFTFNFISPRLKCFCLTRNSNPKTEDSSPSRPVIIEWYGRKNVWSTGSPFMNQLNCAAGFERPDVQFTLTWSPIWYLGRPPVIFGPSSGSTKIKRMKTIKFSCTILFLFSSLSNCRIFRYLIANNNKTVRM